MATGTANVNYVAVISGQWSNVTTGNVSTTNGVAAQASITTSDTLQFTTNLSSFCPVGSTINSMTIYVVARVNTLSDGGGAPDFVVKSVYDDNAQIITYTSTSFTTYQYQVTNSGQFATFAYDGFKITFQDYDFAGGTPTTHYLDNAYIVVDYTPAAPKGNALFFGEPF